MARKGIYTKKVTPLAKIKRTYRRGWRWFKKLSKPKKVALIAGPILAVLILIPLGTYIYYLNDISDQERLMNRNNTGIVMTDKNGETFYSIGKAEERTLVPLADMAESTKEAVIAAEDKDFYDHPGFSVGSILAALYNNVMSQEITGGGSTLTQQLAKNTLLTDDQNFLRKYQELAVSIAIEQQYTKDEILTMYLNSSFFGENAFGIEDAAETYFNKKPKDLTLAESAMLIGVLPAPSVYSPVSGNSEYAKERQTTVLTRMVTNGYITEAEKKEALAVELAYAEPDTTNQGEAPHFAQMVIDQLYEKYGEEKVIRSGYRVETTLDLGLQRMLKANIENHIGYVQLNGGSNAGGVAVDPTSGAIRALVGSADWNNPDWGKVNMATTPRQPGSSFKPIYYSEALSEGIVTPATILEDVPTDFGGYTPQNASRTFSGNISVRNALARSLNIPAVKVMERLGVSKAVEAAQRMGITAVSDENNYGLSLALGAAEAPLLQMTNAYAAFANAGQQYTPTVIKKINNKYDDTLFTAQEKSREVISQPGAFLISSILSDNIARAPIFGSSLTVPGRTAAVKTGTTDESRDAWTIGYTPQLAVGVWVGNNDNRPMLNGGAGMAGPIWVNTMSQALKDVPDTQFAVPSSVIQRPICYGTGALANEPGTNTYNEYFLSWALPTETCNAQQAPPPPPPEQKPENEADTEKEQNPGNSGNSGNGNDEEEELPVDEGDEDGGLGEDPVIPGEDIITP
jgi:penicillin-binding protein 1A